MLEGHYLPDMQQKQKQKRMLGKLSFYGIKGPLLNWIAAFLKDRHQRVVVEGMTSGPEPVASGVTQGSVLGPLLFLLHINDLPNGVTSQVRLFAVITCHCGRELFL